MSSTPAIAATPLAALPAKAAAKETQPSVAATPDAGPPAASSPAAQSTVASLFDQLVEQLVADAIGPTSTAPAPDPVLPAKTPLRTSPSSTTELPPITLPATIKPPDPGPPSTSQPVSRRPDPRSQGPLIASAAQPPMVAADLPVPVNIPLTTPPPPAKNGSPEDSAMPDRVPGTNPTSDALPQIVLEPKPALEVKIHFDQAEALPAVHQVSQTVTAEDVTAPLPAKLAVAHHVEVPVTPVSTLPPESNGRPTPIRPGSGAAVQSVVEAIPSTEGAPAKQQDSQQRDLPHQEPETGPQRPATLRPASSPIVTASTVSDANEHPATRQTAGSATEQAPPTPLQQQPTSIPAITPSGQNGPPPVVGAPPAAPLAPGRPKQEATPTAAPVRSEPTLDPPKAQAPIRSVNLEFTPDGAGDIKLRLSERGGDVHISLHGTDPSLAGRVREGVSDLVGSLSKAGYDAEAWTPSQERQGQGRHQEQRQPARGSGGTDPEEFSSILQQPNQENS